MRFVKNYKGWEIVDSEAGYYLIMKQGEWDYEQIPFPTVAEAENQIDDIVSGVPILTAEEADKAYEDAPAIPISEQEIQNIVKRVTGK